MGTLGRRRAGRDGTGRLGREADATVVGEGRTKDGGRGDVGVGEGAQGRDGSERDCQQSTARRRRGRTESKGETRPPSPDNTPSYPLYHYQQPVVPIVWVAGWRYARATHIATTHAMVQTAFNSQETSSLCEETVREKPNTSLANGYFTSTHPRNIDTDEPQIAHSTQRL